MQRRRTGFEAWSMALTVAGLFLALSTLPAQSKSADGKWLIGFAQDTLNQPWRAYQAKVVERELKKIPNVIPLITDGQGRSERQIANIEDMVTKGVDALIVSPKEEGALTPVVSQVFKKGIPMVLIDRGVKGEDYTSWVKGDNYKIAALTADYIAERFTKKFGEPRGNIVVIEGVPGSTTAVERGAGFKQRLTEKYPKIKIIASQPADYRRDKAMQVMEDFLQAFPKIDAVFTHADESTMGAIYAIENAKRRQDILVTSVNGTMEAIKAIMDGRMDASPLYSNCAARGVDAVMKLLAGQKVLKLIVVDPVMINETNASKFYEKDRYSPD
jgi:ribose transport system substrate-binding protein